LKARHKFSSQDVASLHIVSFHEAVRLGQKNAVTTEEAQYSTSFPCALALVHGTIMPQHVADEALRNPEVQRLSAVLSMGEDDYANRLFPHQRIARAEITRHNNQIFMSEWFEPKCDATAPPAQVELEEKFHSSASPILGQSRTDALHQAVLSLDKTEA
jgi:2-methylcitrate dehydratase PrpD